MPPKRKRAKSPDPLPASPGRPKDAASSPRATRPTQSPANVASSPRSAKRPANAGTTSRGRSSLANAGTPSTTPSSPTKKARTPRSNTKTDAAEAANAAEPSASPRLAQSTRSSTRRPADPPARSTPPQDADPPVRSSKRPTTGGKQVARSPFSDSQFDAFIRPRPTNTSRYDSDNEEEDDGAASQHSVEHDELDDQTDADAEGSTDEEAEESDAGSKEAASEAESEVGSQYDDNGTPSPPPRSSCVPRAPREINTVIVDLRSDASGNLTAAEGSPPPDLPTERQSAVPVSPARSRQRQPARDDGSAPDTPNTRRQREVVRAKHPLPKDARNDRSRLAMFPREGERVEKGFVIKMPGCENCVNHGVVCTIGTGRDDKNRRRNTCDLCDTQRSRCSLHAGRNTPLRKRNAAVGRLLSGIRTCFEGIVSERTYDLAINYFSKLLPILGFELPDYRREVRGLPGPSRQTYP